MSHPSVSPILNPVAIGTGAEEKLAKSVPRPRKLLIQVINTAIDHSHPGVMGKAFVSRGRTLDHAPSAPTTRSATLMLLWFVQYE
ncbi:hypothetical protein VTN96DRAFT_9426 [Rasamsonia emersonii]